MQEAPQHELANWISAGGDVTGDGFADVVEGEPSFDQGRGRVLVFPGSKSGLGTTPTTVLVGAWPGAALGRWIQGVGDINGDGIDDLIVSENDREHSRGDAPPMERTRLVLGGRFESVPGAEWLDSRFTSAGDVNGDGFDDLVAYAREDQVHVLYGSPSGPGAAPDWTVRSEHPDSGFGGQVAAAGDVDGDGCDDLLISAYRFNGRLRHGGKVYLYFGSKSGLASAPGWTAEYDRPVTAGVDDVHEQHFGFGLSSAGDVNRDGFDDILIGARFAEQGDRNEGLAFLYLGSPTGPGRRPDWVAESNLAHAEFGHGVSKAYDLNGDGFDDVIVGAPGASLGQLNEGAVVVYHGSRRGLTRYPVWSMEGDHTHERFGLPVASAGDINGDGYPEVLFVGQHHGRAFKEGRPYVARAVVAYGGPNGLLPSHRWQLRKPLLLGLQHTLERYHKRHGAVVYWGPAVLVFGSVVAGLLWVQFQLRRRVAELLAQNELYAVERERSRIARDVHDHLGAQLTQIALWTQVARSSDRLPEELTDTLGRVSRHVGSAMSDISQLVWTLKPGNESLDRFAAFLGEMVVNFLEPTSIELILDIPEQLPPLRLSLECRQQVLSATREALNNLASHAGATRVTLQVDATSAAVRIRITDNGRGFLEGTPSEPGSKGRPGSGNGLKNMKARLAEIGGRCVVESSPGQGTTITLEAPVETPPDARR